MLRKLAAAMLLAALAACADEGAQPASQPSTRTYPLPPEKPRQPQSSALSAAFTVRLPMARTL